MCIAITRTTHKTIIIRLKIFDNLICAMCVRFVIQFAVTKVRALHYNLQWLAFMRCFFLICDLFNIGILLHISFKLRPLSIVYWILGTRSISGRNLTQNQIRLFFMYIYIHSSNHTITEEMNDFAMVRRTNLTIK